MSRLWVWAQLLIGWLPIWALYSTLIVSAHPGTSTRSAIFAGMRAISCAAALGLIVYRFAQRVPWPTPMRLSFVLAHVGAAAAYATVWVLLSTGLDVALSASHGRGIRFVTNAPLVPFAIVGGWLYVMAAGVSYASQAARRAAQAESLASLTQLAALRSQLNPHFLFNALHTVVQLIPAAPTQATHAAERLAALLRTSLEEQRDLIPLVDEWRFVEQYLELERIRFGDRLCIDMAMDDHAREALVPSFALQTLVENAVRHGAAPRVEPTTVRVRAAVRDRVLELSVHDDGAGADLTTPSSGTGLARLCERCTVLYGDRNALTLVAQPGAGCAATLRVPLRVLHSDN
jgi:hypothetical protein